MLRDIIVKNRSFRRFDASHTICKDTLVKLVDLARLSPSAANKQPLKYFLSYRSNINDLVFPCLRWAAYLKEWAGPTIAERPTAYIVILGDKDVSTNYWCDYGIAAQSMLLGAVEQGLGGCIIGSIDRVTLRAVLGVPERYDVLLVIALGKPQETVIIDSANKGESIEYWRDAKNIHHVPKRRLEDLIIPKFHAHEEKILLNDDCR